jgi:hypothetical protein
VQGFRHSGGPVLISITAIGLGPVSGASHPRQIPIADQAVDQILRCLWKISTMDHDPEFHVPLEGRTCQIRA